MQLNITIDNALAFNKNELQELSEVAYQVLKNKFTYKNPKFLENSRYGYSNHKTPKHLYSYEIHDETMYITRGAMAEVVSELDKFGIKINIIDNTLTCDPVDFEQSNTILREDQEVFVSNMLNVTQGCGQAPTSFGKTVAALELIREIRQPAMIICHTTFLMEQWIKEATSKKLFNLDIRDIGGVGGVFAGKKRRYGKLNICLYHSMVKEEHLDFFKDRIGVLIMDECIGPMSLIAIPNGHKYLKDIQIGDYVLSPSGKKIKVLNKWVKRTKAFKYILKGKNTIIASANHKVKGFNFRWEKVREYKHGEYSVRPISEQTNIAVFNKVPDSRKFERNYINELYGWALADGCKDGDYLKFAFTKIQKYNEVIYLLLKLKKKHITFTNSRGDSVIQLKIDSLPALFNDIQKANNKVINTKLFLACDTSVLRGLFNGDGCFTNSYVEYDTTSRGLIIQMGRMLLSLGVYTHLYAIKKKIKTHNIMYRLIISCESINRFNNIIGFTVKKKNEALLKYLPKVKMDKPTRDIIKVVPLGEMDLIDIEVDSQDHLFIANGLIVSNCQKSPIDAVQKVVNRMPAKYRYAVSAEIRRKDGKEFLTFDAFGPVVTRVRETNTDSKIICNINIVHTKYKDLAYEEDNNYSGMITRMARDSVRNILICKRAIKHVKQGDLVIIFVERKEQAGILAQMLSKFRVDLLTGPISKDDISLIPSLSIRRLLTAYDHKNAYARITKLAEFKKLDIIIGTQKAEVGLSIRSINYGLVTTPMNNHERLKQIKGRIERTYSDVQVQRFGGLKHTPLLEVLLDNGLGPSERAADTIETTYKKRVKIIKPISRRINE